jgi:hypothetical protein
MRRTIKASGPVLTAALVTSAALLLGGCSGDDKPSTPSASSPTDSSSTADTLRLDKANAELEAHVSQIGGGVKKVQRNHISRQIAKPISNWMDDAYLAGKFPRASYSAKDFPGWTPDATKLALKDKEVTTNAAVSKNVVRVVANRRIANLYVFAVGGLTGGATAKILLSMTAEKESGKRMRYTVSGNLYLTRKADKWQIFGYDLHRTVMHR